MTEVECRGAGAMVLTASFALWVALELIRSERGKHPQSSEILVNVPSC